MVDEYLKTLPRNGLVASAAVNCGHLPVCCDSGMRRVSTVESSCGVSQKGALDGPVLEKLRRHAWDKNYYS
jgi:hypothetical protein